MHVAVSALTIQEAGPLEILRECIQAASRLQNLRFTFFVNAALDLPHHPNIKYHGVHFPKRSYLKRLYWEYSKFHKISEELQPDVWLSLADITPKVTAHIRATYVHNAFFQWHPSWKDIIWDPAEVLKSMFFPNFIRIGASGNDFVCCQSHWIANALSSFLRLPPTSFLVMPPRGTLATAPNRIPLHNADPYFFYPAFPRVFKNFETAIRLSGDLNIPLLLTIDGQETRYSRYIKRLTKDSPSIHLMGRKSHTETMELLQESALLLFTSRLETFGLPLLEAAKLGKKILTPYSPWAIEVLKGYPHVYFFRSHQEGLAQARRALQDLPPANDEHRARFNLFAPEIEGFEHLFQHLTGSLGSKSATST